MDQRVSGFFSDVKFHKSTVYLRNLFNILLWSISPKILSMQFVMGKFVEEDVIAIIWKWLGAYLQTVLWARSKVSSVQVLCKRLSVGYIPGSSIYYVCFSALNHHVKLSEHSTVSLISLQWVLQVYPGHLRWASVLGRIILLRY